MSVDGSAFRGSDQSLASVVLADLSFELCVKQALDILKSNEFNARFEVGVTIQEREVIKQSLEDLLNGPNKDAREIAATLINSSIRFNVMPRSQNSNTSGTAGISGNIFEINTAIAKGGLTVKAALSFMTITISREEFNNPISTWGVVASNILDEGTHAVIMATVLSSLATGDPRLYQNRTQRSGEIAAKTIATRYLLHMGGEFTRFGIAIGYIDQNGRKLNKRQIRADSQGNGNVLQYFQSLGIRWKEMRKSY